MEATALLGCKPDIGQLVDNLRKTEEWKLIEERLESDFLEHFGKVVTWGLEEGFRWTWAWINESPSILKKGLKVCAILLILGCLAVAGYYFGGAVTNSVRGALGGAAGGAAIGALLTKVFGSELLGKGEYPTKLN